MMINKLRRILIKVLIKIISSSLRFFSLASLDEFFSNVFLQLYPTMLGEISSKKRIRVHAISRQIKLFAETLEISGRENIRSVYYEITLIGLALATR